jgi:anti-anti-sigma regulatory factor
MKSEALDITIENRGSTVFLVLEGPFHPEQIPNIREKVTGIIDDGNRDIVINLEGITAIGDGVVSMFLSLLNLIRGKHGDVRLVFRNTLVSSAFSQYRSLFSIYPDTRSLAYKGILRVIRRRGILLSRKTGIRLSPPVAIFVVVVLAGWLLTLAFIIYTQNSRISSQETEIAGLVSWQKKSLIEIDRLNERLKPMEQLGLIRDSIPPVIRKTVEKSEGPSADSAETAPTAAGISKLDVNNPEPASPGTVSSDTNATPDSAVE